MEVTTKVTKSSSILYQWYSLVASPEVWVHWLVLWAAINGRWNGRASYVKQGQLFLGEITIGSKFLQLLSSWFWIHDILEKANGSLMEMLVWWRCGGNKKRSSAVAIVDIASATNLYMHTRDYQDDQARHYYNEGPLTKKNKYTQTTLPCSGNIPFFPPQKGGEYPNKREIHPSRSRQLPPPGVTAALAVPPGFPRLKPVGESKQHQVVCIRRIRITYV